ncbi:hypothetical protein [Adlercreutzia sp. ZJ304]|uniref:hypothetical protein n=1 Tax=Adlercreutzia sp. ZJ304 TaxID=2709791 RepID=UPI0013EC92E6|nr:hypothetical protein [Adlercreutzia sp. ZJ304]
MLASTRTNAEQPKDAVDQTSVMVALEEDAGDIGDLPPDVGADEEQSEDSQGSLPLNPEKRKEHIDRINQIERSRKKRHRKKIIRRIMWVIVFALIAALVASVALFSVFRWYTFDDVADMVGTWQLEGSGMQVEISDTTIRLNEDVAYKYSINPTDKTISFKFGNMAGQGRYRFSLDRQQLSITDGEFDFWSTLFEDIPWTVAALFSEWFGMGQLTPGIGDGVTALTKPLDVPANDSAANDTGALDPTLDGQNSGQENGASDATNASDADGAGDSSDADRAANPDEKGDGSHSESSDDSASSNVRDVDALDVPSDVSA